MHLSPDPDFEEFALDCIRLSNQEKSPILRRKLLTLAREWMHAAMHQQGAEIHRESTEPMDANSGEPWSEMDISDLTNELAHRPNDGENGELPVQGRGRGPREDEGAWAGAADHPRGPRGHSGR